MHGEAGTTAALGLHDDVADEAGAVLVALRAVLVVPLVPDARQEGVALVRGGVVDLAGVEARLPGPLGRRGPEIDLVLEFLLGHGPAGQEVGAGQLLFRHGGGGLDVPDLGIPRKEAGWVPGPGMLELDRDRAAELVHRLGEAREAGDEPVVVEVQLHALVAAVRLIVHVLDAQRILDAAGLHHQEAYPAPGYALVVGDHAWPDSLVRLHVRGTVGGLDDAVARLHRADHSRLHQLLETLGHPSVLPSTVQAMMPGSHPPSRAAASSAAAVLSSPALLIRRQLPFQYLLHARAAPV